MIKKKICILLNNIDEYNFESLVKTHLTKDKFDISITDALPKDLSKFDLIIPWSYRKVIKNVNQATNVIIIHSSELPHGRGWAPIYYSINEGQSSYVITCICATDNVDEGDIVIKASFPLLPQYTASYLREIDQEISFVLIKKLLDKWPDCNFITRKQEGIESYRPRRFPEDNEVQISKSLDSMRPHLRSVEDSNPAFFYYKNIKYIISIFPDNKPAFPEKIKIEYPGINEIEYWTKVNDPTQ